jgi:hypothetical protein
MFSIDFAHIHMLLDVMHKNPRFRGSTHKKMAAVGWALIDPAA